MKVDSSLNKYRARLSRTKPHPLYFEQIGDDFMLWSDSYDVAQRKSLSAKLLDHICCTPNALEIGCGFGAMSEFFQNYCDELLVLDVSEVLASRTSKKLGSSACVADVKQLPFNDNSWLLIVTSECVEHTGDPLQAIREMLRILKPGGNLVLTTPNRLWSPLLKASSALQLRKFRGREDFLFPRQIRKLARDLECNVILEGGCHLFPWQIPFVKPVLRIMDNYHWIFRISINYGCVISKPL
jgi:ubiquinone/menaquinone biosynthesis C-methylase UbiE